MKVKDIMPANPINIMVRVFLPQDIDYILYEEDTLFGYCRWDGRNLISEDGDSYDLDDEIVKWEIRIFNEEPFIVYWEKTGEWL